MCGIFGIAIAPESKIDQQNWRDAVRRLFILSETRGKEAAGLAIATKEELFVAKDSVSASEMMKTAEFSNLLGRTANWFRQPDGAALAAIGHSRLVTNGLQGIDANNQPVWRDEVVLIHNGIVVNVDELWEREKANGLAPRAEVDTEVIGALMSRYRREGESAEAAMCKIFDDIYGETSVALFLRDTGALYLATNTGSLYFCTNPAGTAFFFASERLICDQMITGSQAVPGFEGAKVRQLEAGQGATVNLQTLSVTTYELRKKDAPLAAPQLAPMLAVQRKVEEKSARNIAAQKLMKRCTKCLLPETMPFIAYDAEGVCNYCHDYKPWKKRPESELRERLDKVRSKDGSPDCIVAFSGGRDSSYGLHLLKQEYGMTPLTFSYDWGMVTDLARRNQARICGKLGIEHIWVSADIKKKRAHIRRNVLAWLKKPDLGLIPLFMAGDKEVLWHANNLMENYKINEMVFCTNDLEKTIFKQGFLGIDARETTIHKPSSLPLAGKLGMLWNYGSRFVQNPAYFNRSMPDTLFAFFSYYIIKQNYFSLFDYLPWDEDLINKTLIGEYDWETSPDTDSTWRIGDGTAPFYNYVYYTVAGFTEFDTFRSNQIREGMIDRETAWKLVQEENLPRWKSIREYTQMINIDFDETIRVVDRVPKLYAAH
jgi:glutamine---fructose-6-phosphate transaminase (isomerizing)